MRSLRGVLAVACAMALGLVVVPSVGARGYLPIDSFDAASPNGIAVEQETGDVYVVEENESGVINRYSSNGTPKGSLGPFETSTPTGVAVDPTDPDDDGDHNIYVFLNIPERKILILDSGTGAQLAEIVPSPDLSSNQNQISSGGNSNDVLVAPGNVVRYDPDSGTPETATQEITCSTCPEKASFSGGPAGVAADANGNIYVPDTFGQRLVRFGPDGDTGPTPVIIVKWSSLVFPVGVGVNPSNNDVFVSTYDVENDIFKVSAYNSSGNHIVDFGTGTVSGNDAEGIAVNGATGVVYVADNTTNKVHMFDPVEPPLAVTTAASGIGPSTTSLNATVNPNDEDTEVTECYFEWGPTEAYGEVTPCDSAPGAGTSPVQVSADISGLAPSTTYHFRIVAENIGGVSKGDDEEVTTLAQPAPVATTEAASGISQAKATLNAKVNAEGNSASCEFEYGTTTAYGSKAPCSLNPVTGVGAKAVTAAISGLSAGTTYHFRVVATSTGGEAKGNDVTFTTAADTCETNAALCPPPPKKETPPPPPPPPPPGEDKDALRKACLDKAKAAFKRAQRAARKKKGKAKARAMRAANKTKAKAIKRCNAQFS